MRYIIFGDIHGCIEEFNELIEKLNFQETDNIIFAGDLVDKGPYSAEVVKRARELSEIYPTILIEGNHEEKHSRWRRHKKANNKAANKINDAEEIEKITEKLSEEDIAFLDTAKLFYKIPDKNILVVHGGIPPKLENLPLTHEEALNLPKKEFGLIKQFLRIRKVSAEGDMLMLSKENDDDKYWSETYDGRFGKVYYGHQPYTNELAPKEYQHAVCLDLGCVFGGKLAAVIIDDENETFVNVDAKQKYANSLWD